jgi:hypothetical protein
LSGKHFEANKLKDGAEGACAGIFRFCQEYVWKTLYELVRPGFLRMVFPLSWRPAANCRLWICRVCRFVAYGIRFFSKGGGCYACVSINEAGVLRVS